MFSARSSSWEGSVNVISAWHAQKTRDSLRKARMALQGRVSLLHGGAFDSPHGRRETKHNSSTRPAIPLLRLLHKGIKIIYFGDSPGFHQKKIDRFLLSKDPNIGQLIAKGRPTMRGIFYTLAFHRERVEADAGPQATQSDC